MRRYLRLADEIGTENRARDGLSVAVADDPALTATAHLGYTEVVRRSTVPSNMNESLDWQDLRLFVAIARSAGLVGVARDTGLSAATLGRRMTRLESATGRRLFERGRRGYALTADGAALRRVGAVEYVVYHASGLGDAASSLGWVDVEGSETGAARSAWRTAFGTSETLFSVSRLPLGLPIVRAGLARMAIPTFVGDHEAGLERAGDPIAELAHEQWLVAHQDRRAERAVREAIDAIGRRLETLHAGRGDVQN